MTGSHKELCYLPFHLVSEKEAYTNNKKIQVHCTQLYASRGWNKDLVLKTGLCFFLKQCWLLWVPIWTVKIITTAAQKITMQFTKPRLWHSYAPTNTVSKSETCLEEDGSYVKYGKLYCTWKAGSNTGAKSLSLCKNLSVHSMAFRPWIKCMLKLVSCCRNRECTRIKLEKRIHRIVIPSYLFSFVSLSQKTKKFQKKKCTGHKLLFFFFFSFFTATFIQNILHSNQYLVTCAWRMANLPYIDFMKICSVVLGLLHAYRLTLQT
jgi:hypothetical protein